MIAFNNRNRLKLTSAAKNENYDNNFSPIELFTFQLNKSEQRVSLLQLEFITASVCKRNDEENRKNH